MESFRKEPPSKVGKDRAFFAPGIGEVLSRQEADMKPGMEVKLTRNGTTIDGEIISPHEGDDAYDEQTGEPMFRVLFSEEGLQKSKQFSLAELNKAEAKHIKINSENDSAANEISNKQESDFSVGTTVKLMRNGENIFGDIIEPHEGDYSFHEDTGDKLLRVRFSEDGSWKSKQFSLSELNLPEQK